jgi:transposase
LKYQATDLGRGMAEDVGDIGHVRGHERSGCVRFLRPSRVRRLSWPDAKTNSSGGKERLGRVSKMGNRYLRILLVVGAHAVLYHRKPHEDALRSFAKKLMQTKPFKLVAVALANKMARIAFAIMRGRTSYSAVPA